MHKFLILKILRFVSCYTAAVSHSLLSLLVFGGERKQSLCFPEEVSLTLILFGLFLHMLQTSLNVNVPHQFAFH